MRTLRAIINGVDCLSEWTGKVASWVVLAMVLAVSYNVFMRYALNAPTIWSFDLNYMLGGSMMALGQAFVYKHKGHARIDVISMHFPWKTKVIIDIVFTALLFLPVFFMVSKVYWGDFVHSVVIKETMQQSAWYPLAWPFKLMLATGFSFFFLQGIANFIKDVAQLITGSERL